MNMQYSKQALNLTTGFESCSLVAYHGKLDPPDIWTLGYGHTRGVKPGDSCTYSEALLFLRADVQLVVDQINRDVQVPLTQGEFNALVDFGFNLGTHALENSTLWRKLNAGDFAGAAAEFPRWDHAGGVEVEGLLRRRLAEVAEFNQPPGA